MLSSLQRHPLASRAISGPAAGLETASARAVAYDRADPRAGEPLVDLIGLGLAGRNHYARRDGGNAPYHCAIDGAVDRLAARQGVAERLLAVDRRLAQWGLALFVFDAYRPVAVQEGLWRFFRERLSAREPHLSESELDRRTRLYVSDPRGFSMADSRSWPLHATGGAVDLTLADRSTGALIDMGAQFDQMDEASHTAHIETLLRAGAVAADDARLLARRVLYWSLVEAGFTNYPAEYWHYDLGNAMHIACLKAMGEAAPDAAWYPVLV